MIKLAIIGTGSMANAHFEAFSAIDGVEIVAICDVNEKNLKQFAETHGIATIYSSADDLFANEDFDAISNVTPDRFHKPIGLQALAANKHVFSEKPLAENYADARELVLAAKQSGLINMVNFSYLNAAGYQGMAEIVKSGELGRINQVVASYDQCWLTSDYWGLFKEDPRFLWRLSEVHGSQGVLGDTGVHMIDLVSNPVGKIKSINCHLKVFEHKGAGVGEYRFDVNDTFNSMVEFENGAIGTISCSRMATGFKNTIDIRIMGDLGGIKVCFDKWSEDGRHYDITRDVKSDNMHWERVMMPQTPTNFERFISSISTGVNDQPDFERGAEAQKVVDACFESSKWRRWVDI